MLPVARPAECPSELRALLNLALPIVLGQWAQMAMHTIDTAMVGRLGVDAVAASSLGSISVAPFFMALGGLGAALPPLMARLVAAGDRVGADRLLRQAWTCALVLTIAAAAGFTFAVRWLPGNGLPEAVVANARSFATILIWTLVPTMLLQNLRGLAEANNRPWLPLTNIVLGLAVNVGCNTVLIYGLGPIPRLGLPGAAIGTCIARLTMLAHFIIVIWRRPELRPAPGWLTRVPCAWTGFRSYLQTGGLTAVSILLVVGSSVVMTFVVARHGPAVLAAHEITRQVWMLAYVIPVGWSTAAALRTGWWLGRGDGAALQRSARLTFLVGSGVGLTLALGILALRGWLPVFFLGPAAHESAAVVAAQAEKLLPIAAFLLLCEGILLTSVGICRGLSHMLPVAAAYLFSYWLLGLGAGIYWSRPERGDVRGVWLGMALGVSLGAAWLVLVTIRRLRRMDVTLPAPVPASGAETTSRQPA
jgi:MATE family multidrug resistance protein